MNYTLNQLQIFLKIVETRSITKAAEELHLTQPAVSIQLKNFQDQFDIPLTELIGRQIYITEFGKEIGEAAEKIIGIVGRGSIELHGKDADFPSRGALNIDAARKDFGYDPKVDVEEGFYKYYHWLQNSTYWQAKLNEDTIRQLTPAIS